MLHVTNTSTPRRFWRKLHVRKLVILFASLLFMCATSVFNAPAYAATRVEAQTTWQTFHDPVYGLSLQYPNTWTLISESNGSHITLFNLTTRTTMSPIVTTQAGTPSAILKQALSVPCKLQNLVSYF